MNYQDLNHQGESRGLTILGGFHPKDEPFVPAACKTLVLLGPKEPTFWPTLKASPEWLDGQADPMDRWSSRVIGDWASEIAATPLFPFGGPPFLPFFSWATKSGRIHSSPIMLLVHDTAGLFVSFRGALALSVKLILPEAPPNPCIVCETKPCTTACPVDAFDGATYDVPRCKSFLGSSEGTDCMSKGCAARRACPVSASYQRLEEQSAYHMSAFKG